MKTLLSLLTLTFLLPVLANAQDQLLAAEHAIQGKQFDKAVALVDEHLAAADAKRADYASYLKALALYHDGKDQAAVKACNTLLEQFKKTPWNRKALFLKSRALVRQKKFKEAEAIYEAEANRLFSADRKKSLANVLVEFGDELSRKPAEDELDAPPQEFVEPQIVEVAAVREPHLPSLFREAHAEDAVTQAGMNQVGIERRRARAVLGVRVVRPEAELEVQQREGRADQRTAGAAMSVEARARLDGGGGDAHGVAQGQASAHPAGGVGPAGVLRAAGCFPRGCSGKVTALLTSNG